MYKREYESHEFTLYCFNVSVLSLIVSYNKTYYISYGSSAPCS